MYNTEYDQRDRDLDLLWYFQEWLGDWLRQRFDAEAYQEPNENDPPGPSRYLWRSNGKSIAIWICLGNDEGEFGVNQATSNIWSSLRANADLGTFDLILASPDDIEPQLAASPLPQGVRVLDARCWLDGWEEIQCWHAGVAALLARRLTKLPPGQGAGADKLYEVLVGDVMRFLFYPSLFYLRPQHATDSRAQRRDHLLAIDTRQPGVWRHLAFQYGCTNLVVEAKNMSGAVGVNEVNSVAGYLHPHAPGNVGVLASRERPNSVAYKRIREIARDGKVILPIDDRIVLDMLAAKRVEQTHGNGPDYVMQHIVADVTSG